MEIRIFNGELISYILRNRLERNQTILQDFTYLFYLILGVSDLVWKAFKPKLIRQIKFLVPKLLHQSIAPLWVALSWHPNSKGYMGSEYFNIPLPIVYDTHLRANKGDSFRRMCLATCTIP